MSGGVSQVELTDGHIAQAADMLKLFHGNRDHDMLAHDTQVSMVCALAYICATGVDGNVLTSRLRGNLMSVLNAPEVYARIIDGIRGHMTGITVAVSKDVKATERAN